MLISLFSHSSCISQRLLPPSPLFIYGNIYKFQALGHGYLCRAVFSLHTEPKEVCVTASHLILHVFSFFPVVYNLISLFHILDKFLQRYSVSQLSVHLYMVCYFILPLICKFHLICFSTLEVLFGSFSNVHGNFHYYCYFLGDMVEAAGGG